MSIYVICVHGIYTLFFLSEGKPVKPTPHLPVPSERIKSGIDIMEQTIINGNSVFRLEGWAFLQQEPQQANYERWIIFQSDSRTYSFPTKITMDQNIQKIFPDTGIDLSNSGFYSDISIDFIKPGIYTIGFLYRQPSNEISYYSLSNKMLMRTPNTVKLVPVKES